MDTILNYPDGIYKANNHGMTYLVMIQNKQSTYCVRHDKSVSDHSSFYESWGTYTPATVDEMREFYRCFIDSKWHPPVFNHIENYEVC